MLENHNIRVLPMAIIPEMSGIDLMVSNFYKLLAIWEKEENPEECVVVIGTTPDGEIAVALIEKSNLTDLNV